MTAKEFITKYLANCEYGYDKITPEALRVAKDNGLVIIYGYSDDLIEADGAIYDEGGCYDGGSIFLSPDGFCEAGTDGSREILIFWCRNEYAWEYETDIPHETFEVMEGEDKYCLGMVFNVKDI